MFICSLKLKTKTKISKGFLTGERTYTEEEDRLGSATEVTGGDGTGNSRPTIETHQLTRRRRLSAEGQRRAPPEYRQLASELSAIATPKPHSDGVSKVAVAAGGRDDIALDVYRSQAKPPTTSMFHSTRQILFGLDLKFLDG
ncbi:hypothetical protein ARMGADRAFT_1036193 [Armillaria gallica]|uniref:Uncharacterized protein n=1 Tax=Armillaria gallica TaxID=47427 RepID=A0A2H3CVA8_ARMGA|nr:hypothetical protein ARMGADRAFT_1036193 [Armillaria gallica]